MLCKSGPNYGYFPKPSKSWVITKPEFYDEAKKLFPGLNVTDIGHKYLGSFIGSEEGKNEFIEKKIKHWVNDIDELSDIATREPQVVYAAYIYGQSKRWNYVCRTTPGISSLLNKLEFKIRETFIPSILDRAFSCTETCRKIFALPAREGGLGIYNISETSELEYKFSLQVTEKLSEAICNQNYEYFEDPNALHDIKTAISRERRNYYQNKRKEIYTELNESEKLQLDLASEKGASAWLTSLPLKSFGYLLNKQEFNDAVCLRYNMKIKDTAKRCVCDEINTINHSLTCKRGGYVSLRHNSLRDTTAKILQTTCRDVVIEPTLLPTAGVVLPPGSNTADNARLDVSARSVWNPLERAFCDVRVFHAPALSNRNLKTLPRMYEHHEKLKKTAYNSRVIEVERGVFTPLVFSTSGGMGEEAKRFFKKLATLMTEKTGQKYSETMTFIRKRLRFDLLKTTIIALRGYRGKAKASHTEVGQLDLNLAPKG